MPFSTEYNLCSAKGEDQATLNELERQMPIGKIDCGEVVAYLRASSRYYNRKCSRMGDECRDKDIYPVKWFDQVVQMMTQVCHDMQQTAKGMEKRMAETPAKGQTKKPPCGSRNRVM